MAAKRTAKKGVEKTGAKAGLILPDGKPVPRVDPDKIPEAKRHWLVRPKTIRTLIMAGTIVLLALTLADMLIQGHADFGIDGSFGFYIWYGFVTCAAMVVFAKLLGYVVKQPDTYYDD